MALDDGAFETVPGSVALNESGKPLEWIQMTDGVPMIRKPRLERKGSLIRISLDDLAKCVERWQLSDDGAIVVLEGEGHTLALLNEDAGLAATADGTELTVTGDDFDFSREGHFISATLLAEALGGEAEWDEEEKTLMLRIPEKTDAEATD